LVLAGGGSLGAVQVGTLRALVEAGVEFDLVVGTSVGAVNAAWLVGDPTPSGVAELTRIWRGLRRGHVFPTNPVRGVLAAAGQRRSGWNNPRSGCTWWPGTCSPARRC
jgi:NTE family protein